MKRLTRVALIIAATLFVGGLFGCTTPKATEVKQGQSASKLGKVAIGIRKPKHLKVAMMTAHNMLSNKGHRAKQVSIVACGPAVKDLQTSSPVASKVKQSLDNDIRIVACGVTVDRMGLDKDSFISGVIVVPNGITELARLQANGYVSIEL